MRATAAGLLFALAACHGGAGGPAWPKSAGTVTPANAADDGGESLEPRASHVAAIEVAADDSPSAGAVVPDLPASDTPATDKPTETPTAPTTETIEIQIEDIEIGPGDVIINGS